MTTDPCSLCSGVSLKQPKIKDQLADVEFSSEEEDSSAVDDEIRDFLFHGECTECSDVHTDPICEFCAHMRLRHFIRCGLYGRYYSTESDMLRRKLACVDFSLGTMKDVRRRARDCSICSRFAASLESSQPSAPISFLVFSDPPLHELNTYEVVGVLWDFLESSKSSLYFGMAREPDENDFQDLNPMVDWSQVRFWLQDCSENHGTLCYEGPLGIEPTEFRMIDCERGCIVRAPYDEDYGPEPVREYATLSYVWGKPGPHDLQATVDNIHILETEGVLFNGSVTVPATISDAITVCKILEIKYLWVDRLCIIQDDKKEVKDDQINCMGKIYRCSSLTIVAMAGTDVHSGLPGVSTRRRTAPPAFQMQGTSWKEDRPSYEQLVYRSKWNSRGWKLQEAELSPRLLIFSDYAVFFECDKIWKLRSEDDHLRKTKEQTERQFGRHLVAGGFQMTLKDFTSRDLTCPSDALRAFSGFLGWNWTQDYYYGIRFPEFTSAILWQSIDGKYLPRLCDDGEVFPSWSWSSIMGGVEVIQSDFGVAAPLARWATTEPDCTGPQCIIEEKPINPAWLSPYWNPEAISWAMLMAWKNGCFPTRPPASLDVHTTWKEYSRLIEIHYPDLPRLVKAAHGDREDIMSKFAPYYATQPGLLMAYTQSRLVRLIFPPSPQPAGSAAGYIKMSSSGADVVGWLIPKATDHKKLYEIYKNDPNPTLDILAVAVTAYPCPQFDETKDNCIDKTPIEENMLYEDSTQTLAHNHLGLCLFMVQLMLVYTENGISRRLGLGLAHLRRWVDTRPEFHTFVLG